MAFAGIDYLAVLVAAAAGFAFGAAWYGLLGKAWVAALGKPKDRLGSMPQAMALSALCQLAIAWVLAGLLGHVGTVTLPGTLISAAFVWGGFVLTTTIVNHRWQGASWRLTAIDAGHWLGVLLVMGLVIGLFGI
jgi:hypothetical protein